MVCYSSSNHELGFCNKQTCSSKWWSWCSSSRYLLACPFFKNEDALLNHKHRSELVFLFPLLIVSSFNLFMWKYSIFVFLHAFGVYIWKSECFSIPGRATLCSLENTKKKKKTFSIIPYTNHNHSIPFCIPFMRNWKEYNLFLCFLRKWTAGESLFPEFLASEKVSFGFSHHIAATFLLPISELTPFS